MSRELFMHIAKAVEAHCPYFMQKRNASGELGHNVLKKIAASARMLAYGCPADVIDDWIHIVENTVIKSLKKFVKSAIDIFGEHYLREPNAEDTARLMQMGESKGFRSMLGCIDCIHWRWENYPAA
ncbi:uncharacterized protein C2845_PM15G00780 [Panicum miliaceum]|uniref:Nuclease HARBI1 n=1 Tax=Panicum miliaceum TaxID=4540 RepID=A0A3L6Q9K3_PANMI|nr:uncharacterized protein C2845_PM15G00780 [Panicum miliaceum]